MTYNNQVSTACQINVDGLSNHSITALEKFIDNNNIDVLAIQEVGMNSIPVDTFKGKSSFSTHFVKGVSLSITNKHRPQLINELSDPEIDAVFVLSSIQKMSILTASCYCRPEITSTNSLKKLLGHLDKAWKWCKKQKVSNMIVYGDFNARNIAWGDSILNQRGRLLGEYIEQSNHIVLHSAGCKTFLSPGGGGSCIDLSLSYGDIHSSLDIPWVEHCYTLFSGAPQRGHIPVLQNIRLQPSTKETRRTVFDYESADWSSWHISLKSKFKNSLSITFDDAEAMFEHFLTVIKEGCDEHVPTKKLCKHSKPFWSIALSEKSSKLQHAQQQYKVRSDPSNKARLEECKSNFKESLIEEKNNWIHRKLEGLNIRDSIEFWKRYKKQFSPTSNNFMGHLKKLDSNGLTHDDAEKEEILFETFFSGHHLRDQDFDDAWKDSMEAHVLKLNEEDWGLPNANDIPEQILEQDENLDNNFLNSEILFDEVVAAISAQKTAGKCSDMDKFHPLLLKKLPSEAIRFLTKLYNKVLSNGRWAWNSAMVTFIRKMDKESYLVPGSFRPITISSYVGKIMERVLQQRLLIYCQRNKLIDDAQEGFLPQRSTTRYLYKMSASIAEARRKRMSVMLLFCDFEKAFDSVSTTAMVYKLNMLGISGSFLKLINSFLTDRYVTLRVNAFIGPSRRVSSFGLPQGSVLSPLLFVIFVSDLFENIRTLPNKNESALVFKYADDGSVMVASKSMSESFNLMQKICNLLTSWCKRWRLVVNCNKNKTEAVIVKSKDSSTTVIGKLMISGKQIEFVKKSRVLGILIDENLTFQDQARSVLRGCWYEWHRLSSNTTRKRGLNTSTLTLLFKTAVLTKLMYGAPVWLHGNMDTFKSFTSKALLKISGSQFYSSNAVLEVALGIPPLQLNLDVMTIKFIMKGLNQDDELKAIILQLEECPAHPFYRQMILTKEFISWKRAGKLSSCRTLTLIDLTNDETMYSQNEMQQFMCARWDRWITTNDTEHFTGKWNVVAEQTMRSLISTHNAINKPLFLRNDTRTQNSNMLDFLHGHCLRFQDFRKTVKRGCLHDKCLDCSEEIDSPTHKLFFCSPFSGTQRKALVTHLDLSNEELPLLKLKLLFSPTPGLRRAYKEMVSFICLSSQHGDFYNCEDGD